MILKAGEINRACFLLRSGHHGHTIRLENPLLPAGPENFGKGFRRQGTIEQKALDHVAAFLGQDIQLIPCLDAFRHHPHPQGARIKLGPRAPDIVFPYGGADSYWHDRADGAWASYVTREVIPQALARLHADPRRIAIGGISMGGFGALDIARLHPGRFCAAGGHSAALFTSGALSAAGAFDDAADFARHDVILALKRDGQYMSVRDKGPLFIVYPFDSDPALRHQRYYSRSAWQLARLVVA